MTHWNDTMVDRPESDGVIYITGWSISGLAVLGAIFAVFSAFSGAIVAALRTVSI
jgi:hypothetical protein